MINIGKTFSVKKEKIVQVISADIIIIIRTGLDYVVDREHYYDIQKYCRIKNNNQIMINLFLIFLFMKQKILSKFISLFLKHQ